MLKSKLKSNMGIKTDMNSVSYTEMLCAVQTLVRRVGIVSSFSTALDMNSVYRNTIKTECMSS